MNHDEKPPIGMTPEEVDSFGQQDHDYHRAITCTQNNIRDWEIQLGRSFYNATLATGKPYEAQYRARAALAVEVLRFLYARLLKERHMHRSLSMAAEARFGGGDGTDPYALTEDLVARHDQDLTEWSLGASAAYAAIASEYKGASWSEVEDPATIFAPMKEGGRT